MEQGNRLGGTALVTFCHWAEPNGSVKSSGHWNSKDDLILLLLFCHCHIRKLTFWPFKERRWTLVSPCNQFAIYSAEKKLVIVIPVWTLKLNCRVWTYRSVQRIQCCEIVFNLCNLRIWKRFLGRWDQLIRLISPCPHWIVQTTEGVTSLGNSFNAYLIGCTGSLEGLKKATPERKNLLKRYQNWQTIDPCSIFHSWARYSNVWWWPNNSRIPWIHLVYMVV